MAITGSQAAYKHARAGVARAGASRSNYYQPIRVAISIDGTTRTANVDIGSVVITDLLGAQYNTCTLRVFGFTPSAGEEIIITLGAADNRLFAGHIQKCTAVVGTRSFERVDYELYCVDYTWTLDKYLVTQQFPAVTTANETVANLISTFASGFTTNHLQTGLGSLEDLRYRFTAVSQVLNDIAQTIGGYWYVDYHKDVHMFVTEPTYGAPETLSTSSKHEWRALQHETDLSQVRNRLYVEGPADAQELIAPRDVASGPTLGVMGLVGLYHGGQLGDDTYFYTNRTVPGIGSSDRYLIDQSLYKEATWLTYSQITTTAGVGTIGSTTLDITATTGLPSTSYGGVVIIEGQIIMYDGVDTGTPKKLTGIPATGFGSIQATISNGADVIRPYVAEQSGAYVGQSHSQGTPVIPVRIRKLQAGIDAMAAAMGDDGIWEGHIGDSTLGYLTAAARGDAEVTAWGSPLESIRFWTRDPNARSGADVTVNVAGLSGTYRIQRVTIQHLEDTQSRFPWREVEAGSQRFNLFDLLRNWADHLTGKR